MKRLSLFLFVTLFLYTNLHPTVKGSETVLSIEPYYTFLASENDNTMLGFGWFKSGFGLEDAATSCTFNSVFPVSGDISLNGGTLYLNRDFTLNNISSFLTPGFVFGNNYLFDLCSSLTFLGSPLCEQVFNDAHIHVDSNLLVTGTVRFEGNCILDGCDKRILFGDQGCVIIGEEATVTFKSVFFAGVSSGKFFCADDSGKIIFENSSFLLDGNYSFTTGSFEVSEKFTIFGENTFSYHSVKTSTIRSHSELYVKDGVNFSLERNGAVEPLYSEDESSVLHLDNCTISAGVEGATITRGTLLCDHEVLIDIESTGSTDGIILGDGTLSGDLKLVIETGASVVFADGDLVYNLSQPNLLTTRGGGSRFIRYGGTNFFINQNLVLADMHIVDENYGAAMIVADGKTVNYNSVTFEWPWVVTEMTASRENYYTNVLSGNQELSLLKGVLPAYTVITNTGNFIHGIGGLSGQIILSNSDSEVQFKLQGPLIENVILNGGLVTLLRDLEFSQGYGFVGSGTVDLSSNALQLGPSDQTWSGGIEWSATGGKLVLNSKVSLSGTWTFNGSCTIDGNNQPLVLEDGGEIVVAPGATLDLKDLRVEGVHGNNVICDDSAKIVFENSSILLDGDYSFTTGSFSVADNFSILGSDTFSYHSIKTSTIRAHSELLARGGCTLSLERNGTVEPLYSEDESSILHLDTCTISAGVEGVSLTRGTVLCDHEVLIDIDSTGTENGIVLGDGTPSGDLKLVIETGAAVHFVDGNLVYNMSQPDLLMARGGGSRLIRYGGTNFFIKENLALSDMHVVDENYGAAMTVADGKTVNYNNVTFEWPWVVTEMTASRENYYTNVLSGNQELSLLKGVLPAYTVIMNKGNFIHGIGGLSGQIILLDSDAEVQFKLQGPLIENVILNGGLVTLLRDLELSQDYGFEGSGTVDLAGNSLRFGPSDQSWPGGIDWSATGGKLVLNSTVSLSGTWTFNGACAIDGNGHTLVLEDGGAIVVAPESSLDLKNIRVDGVHENNVRCDDSAKIVFENTSILLDGNYSFTTGSFSVYANFTILGTDTFSYHSVKTSTIHAHSELLVKDGVIFSLERNGVVEPLYSEDESSILHLDNCTLTAGTEGVSITRGTLLCHHGVRIDISSTGSADGIILGDGTVAGDLNLIIESGAEVHFVNGSLVYNMSRPDLFTTRGGGSRMTRYSGTTFFINQDIALSNMNVIDENFTVAMNVADGKTVSYNNVTFEWPGVTIDMTANRVNYYMNALVGNQELTLLKGVLPSYMLIMNKGNVIDGVGSLSGQVILSDSDAEVQFKLQGPFMEDVILNGGLVTLLRDLEFSQGYGFKGFGNVDLADNTLQVGPSDQPWSGGIGWSATGGKIVLNSNVSLSGTWTFSGSCTIDGNGNTLMLEDGGEIIVAPGATLDFKDLRIDHVHGSNIRCDDSGQIVFENSSILLDGDYSFTSGSFSVDKSFTILGVDTFSYHSEKTSTIRSCSKILVKDGVIFSLERNGTVEPLYSEDASSILHLDNCTMGAGAAGFSLTRGTLLCDHEVCIDVNSTGSLDGIILGDGTVAGDLNLIIEAGAAVRFVDGDLVYNMSRPDLFTTRGGGSRMTRYSGTTFFINQDIVLSNMNVIDENFTVAMVVVDGKTVSYNNVIFEWPGVVIDMTASRANYYTNVLAGNQKLTLLKGILPSYMLIINKGNLIDGVGSLSGQVILSDSDAEVQFKLQGPFMEDVILNGGLVTLLRDLEFSQGYGFKGFGNVDLADNTLQLGPSDQTWSGVIDWNSTGGKIVFNSTVSLSGTWTFNGTCAVDGNGHTLVIEGDGEIVIAPGSSLTLNNLRIEGVHGNNIRCVDSTARLSLGDLVWLQDGVYSFTTGAMEVRGDLALKGETVFAYQSAQTSTVFANARLLVDRGMTFSFDPIWNDTYSEEGAWETAKEFLAFEDDTSMLELKGSTLHVTTTGMKLKKGMLLIKDRSNFVSELDGLFHMEEGIIIGDNDASKDMYCEIGGGSALSINGGALSYKNVDSYSLNMLNDRSIINVGESSKLKLHQSLDAGSGNVVFYEGSVLARASDCTLVGALHMLGSVYYEFCYN